MKDDQLRRMAKRRVEFKDHIMIYLVVNAALIGINLLTVPQFWWFMFPLVFWGIGLAFHWREAYHGDEGDRVEREYQKLKRTNNVTRRKK